MVGIQGILPAQKTPYLFCWDFKFSWKIAGGPCGLPIVPCGSLGCLLPLGGNLRVSKKAPLLAHLIEGVSFTTAIPRIPVLHALTCL